MERAKENTLTNNLVLIRSKSRKQVDRSQKVEFSIDGLDVAYQFKIWNKSPNYMCFLIKENSGILSRLKVGDTLNMRYYYTDSTYPSENLETAIQHITKKDQGRFKGQYIVGLEILRSRYYEKTH